MLPNLDEIMMSPAFTDAERAEYQAIKAQHADEIAELQAQLEETKKRQRQVYGDILNSAQRGIPVAIELIGDAINGLKALAGLNIEEEKINA